MNYIKKPNLPQSVVASVAISSEAGEAIKTLEALGIKTYLIPPNSALPAPVASHSDMQLLHMGGSEMFTFPEHLYAGELSQKFFLEAIGELPNSQYPFDVPLNACIIDKYIICNERTVSNLVLSRACELGLTPIFVNQGYTKCSVCVIDESSIITDDIGIFKSAGNFLNDVLFISKGSIRLDGYGYGFFGGCCGKIGKDTLAVNGRLERHPEHNSIIDFLSKHNVEIKELTDNPRRDIGSIIPLTEV